MDKKREQLRIVYAMQAAALSAALLSRDDSLIVGASMRFDEARESYWVTVGEADHGQD